MDIQCAGLIFDDSIHYLDHLAPFCSLMGWPLYVFDESIAELSQRFYPMTNVIHTDFSALRLPPCIVTCNTRPSINLALGPLSSWNGRVIWLPHGWSDKGWKSPFLEALGREDLLLVYGERMRQVLRTKNIALPQVAVGNYRWQFYQTHQAFYNKLMDKYFERREFVLYAPTWDDSEENGSFWRTFDSLVRAVPSHQLLFIKVHPNTQKKSPAKLEHCRGIVDTLPNVSFVDDFPPIYPLLDRAQAYIGDMSSIGYDYLRFGRPLFFLTDQVVDPGQNPSAHLMQCGEQIRYDEVSRIFRQEQKSSEVKLVAQEAFDEISRETIQQKINEWVSAWQ